MATEPKLTHADLVTRAVLWLQGSGRCTFAFSEFRAYTTEIPDAIGFRSRGSVIVECKVSRSDFQRDRHKVVRRMPDKGMGQERYFMVPAGLIAIDEVPDKWGLLYVHQRHVKVAKKSGGFPSRAYHDEMSFLYSMLRRAEIRAIAVYATTGHKARPADFLNQWLKDGTNLLMQGRAA